MRPRRRSASRRLAGRLLLAPFFPLPAVFGSRRQASGANSGCRRSRPWRLVLPEQAPPAAFVPRGLAPAAGRKPRASQPGRRLQRMRFEKLISWLRSPSVASLIADLAEGQHLQRDRLLGVLNPATVVINSVSSAAVLNVCGESVADHQDDSVPARITVVSQISSDDQNARTRGAAADIHIAVDVGDLRSGPATSAAT